MGETERRLNARYKEHYSSSSLVGLHMEQRRHSMDDSSVSVLHKDGGNFIYLLSYIEITINNEGFFIICFPVVRNIYLFFHAHSALRMAQWLTRLSVNYVGPY